MAGLCISHVTHGCKVLVSRTGDDARWQHPLNAAPRAHMVLGLQQHVGNRAVQRMMVQRRGKGLFTIDEDVQDRIQRERGSGQPLDPAGPVLEHRLIPSL